MRVGHWFLAVCLAVPASAAIPAHACPPLATLASRQRWFWGTAIGVQSLEDAATIRLVKTHVNVVVPENALKWDVINPRPGVDHFSDFARIQAAFAGSAIRFRGHPLVWHEQLPAWLQAQSPQSLKHSLHQHITRMVSAHRGRVISWDVINEPLAPNGQGLRRTLWWQALGPAYIADALRWARAADADVQLVINEYGLEGDDAVSLLKRQSLLELVRRLRRQGVPLDAIGLQAHLRASDQGPTFHSLPLFMAELRRLGLKIIVTELDVNDADLPSSPESRDQRVASIYHDFIRVLVAEPAVEGIVQWGLTDRYTWLNHVSPRSDGMPQRPLLFDDALQPKTAFATVCRLLMQNNGGTRRSRAADERDSFE